MMSRVVCPSRARPGLRLALAAVVCLIALAIAAGRASAAAGDIDQCANGGVGATPLQCTGAQWQNGNLNQTQAHYIEGDSVPYRLIFPALVTGPSTTHTVTIEWDTTASGKHGLDYLTTFNRTESNADPCSGITGCGTGLFAPTTFLIPDDPNIPASITQLAGDFTLYGGTITGVSAYTLSGTYAGNSSTSIQISFTAAVSQPVLAWSGHIASRFDWGAGNSAGNINGSSYHMRLKEIDLQKGQSDRSLSAAAVITPGRITIVKAATPEGPTSFPFTSALLGGFSLVDDGTPTDTKVFDGLLTFGDYTVTETPIPSGWQLTGITCVNDVTNAADQNTSTSVPTATATIGLDEGELLTCTFNDGSGTLEVVKQLSPAGDGGLFNLNIDGGANEATDVGNNGTTGDVTVVPGSHTVTEAAGSGTTLANYNSTLECRAANGTGAVVPSAGGNVTVNAGDDIRCVFTNTRRGGTLELKKTLSPTSDTGRFNLNIDGGADEATNIGNNGTTGAVSVSAGDHTIAESGFGTTNLANYTSTVACLKSGGGSVPLVNGSVAVGSNDQITCTITNTRNNGTLTVVKHLDPAADTGTFDLRIDGAVAGTGAAVGNNGTTGAISVGPGQHSVSEVGAGTPATDLAKYSAVTVCKDAGGNVVGSGGTTSAQVLVDSNDQITCTITNTRKGGTLELKKALSPADDSGKFNLNIDGGANEATNIGNGGTTGPVAVAPGSHTLAESGAGGTLLSNYTSSTACLNAAGATVPVTNDSVTVDSNDVITCTITNTRNTGSLEVVKVLEPAGNQGKFNLNVDGGANEATNVGNGGTTGKLTLPTGVHTVAESAGTATTLTDYTASIVCKDGGGSGTTIASGSGPGPLSVTLAKDADVLCTITNTLRTQVSQITPTNTTCQMFRDGTALNLSTLEYSTKGATINQVNPGVLFYWVKVTGVAGANSLTITQTITSANNNFTKKLTVAAGSNVFNAGCTAVKGMKITQNTSTGTVTVTFTGTAGATYYIGIKFDPKAVKGATAPSPNTTVQYQFATTGLPGSTNGLSLLKKN